MRLSHRLGDFRTVICHQPVSMSPTFYLRNPKAKKPTLIYYQINIYGFRIRYPLGIKILPYVWISKHEEVKNDYPDAIKINLYLAKLRAKTSQAILDFKIQGTIPTKQQFTEIIFEQVNKDNIFDRVDEFLIEHRKRTRSTSFKYIQHALINFQKFKPHCTIPGSKDLEDYAKWMMGEKYNPNYVLKQVDSILRFCRWSGLDIKIKLSIKPAKSEGFVYLTPDEIEGIMNCSIPDRLERSRDLFLFALDTGMRYEDLLLFKKSWLVRIPDQNGNTIDCISYIPHKTQTRAVVPIFENAKKVLKKYNGDLPLRISEQKYRIGIKQVCACAGINQDVTIIHTRGNTVETQQVRKYEAVACRTAKRSFVTNMLDAGRSIREVAHMTGNSQEHILRMYDKLTPERNAVNVFENLKGKG